MGEVGLVLMGSAMLSKSLIQLSVDVWVCVPTLLFDLRPKYGGGDEDNDDLLQRVHAGSATLVPPSLSRPPLTHASTRDSRTLTPKSGSVSCGVTSPFSLVRCAQDSFFALQESVTQSCVSSEGSIVG